MKTISTLRSLRNNLRTLEGGTAKTTEQIAEEMANECAQKLHSHYNKEWFNGIPNERRENYREIFEQEEAKRSELVRGMLHCIPIAQLIAVARAADKHTCTYPDKHLPCKICKALDAIKQNGIEL